MNLHELKIILKVYNELSDYVYLREDDKSRYIEYAFKEGKPHDCRCLSWYYKAHPKAFERNRINLKHWIETHSNQVNKLYELHSFSCDNQNKEGAFKCCPGHPKQECLKTSASDWTYEEPIKCACWNLEPITLDELKEKYKLVYKTYLALKNEIHN